MKLKLPDLREWLNLLPLALNVSLSTCPPLPVGLSVYTVWLIRPPLSGAYRREPSPVRGSAKLFYWPFMEGPYPSDIWVPLVKGVFVELDQLSSYLVNLGGVG